jgi:hypothetical protein
MNMFNRLKTALIPKRKKLSSPTQDVPEDYFPQRLFDVINYGSEKAMLRLFRNIPSNGNMVMSFDIKRTGAKHNIVMMYNNKRELEDILLSPAGSCFKNYAENDVLLEKVRSIEKPHVRWRTIEDIDLPSRIIL